MKQIVFNVIRVTDNEIEIQIDPSQIAPRAKVRNKSWPVDSAPIPEGMIRINCQGRITIPLADTSTKAVGDKVMSRIEV